MTGRTRRQLLVALAPPVSGGRKTTRDILREAVELEQYAVVAYDAAATKLDGELARTSRLFREQEREHARGLRGVLRHIDGDLPLQPEGPHEIEGLESALDAGPEAFARFAIRLEEAAVALYYEAQAVLRDRSLLTAVTGIMANEGQHLVVLRESLGREPLPGAFETGGAG